MLNSNANEKLYQIALTLIPNIGATLAKNLLAYCGSAEKVFQTPKAKLEKIPLIGSERAEAIAKADVLKQAEAELQFTEDYKINSLFFTDSAYPQRLKQCNDSPVMLYYKGNADLNAEKVVGIVGTRKATNYGKETTKKMVSSLSTQNILVVSGLAYGIDISAHNAALEFNLQTVGVLGHGLNTIYPSQHVSTAKKMVEHGGLLTEYLSTDEMHPSNFADRNRIIAGMCDALVVVESGVKGGAVITANLAYSYNRDVFAVPGKTTDKQSEGCNFLIKTCKAKLIETAEDLLTEMNWVSRESTTQKQRPQRQLAFHLNEDEQRIYTLLNEKQELPIDVLTMETGMNTSALSAILLEMEMNNILVSLPGKRYKLI